MPRLLVALACAACALPVAAGEFVPGGNSGALARGFALPVLGDGAVLASGRAETALVYDVTNEFVSEGDCAIECITLDGETSRLRLSHRRGFGKGWDVRLDVPLLHTGGGYLDGWIQDWHRWFGLPTGGREAAVNGQYRFRYARGGVALLDVTETDSGLGDVTVGLGRRLGPRLALRMQAKLPTGDAATLLGGNAGGAIWLDGSLPLPPGWDGYLAFGLSTNEQGEVLESMQNTDVAFGGIGLLAPLTESVRLLMQLNAHTRLYEDSALTPLERPGVPLTLGLQIRTGPRGRLDLGFQEDPSVNGSPDFTAYVALSYLPRTR